MILMIFNYWHLVSYTHYGTPLTHCLRQHTGMTFSRRTDAYETKAFTVQINQMYELTSFLAMFNL